MAVSSGLGPARELSPALELASPPKVKMRWEGQTTRSSSTEAKTQKTLSLPSLPLAAVQLHSLGAITLSLKTSGLDLAGKAECYLPDSSAKHVAFCFCVSLPCAGRGPFCAASLEPGTASELTNL